MKHISISEKIVLIANFFILLIYGGNIFYLQNGLNNMKAETGIDSLAMFELSIAILVLCIALILTFISFIISLLLTIFMKKNIYKKHIIIVIVNSLVFLAMVSTFGPNMVLYAIPELLFIIIGLTKLIKFKKQSGG